MSRFVSDDRPRCLVYHDIAHDDERDTPQMTVPLRLFKEQLDVASELGYRFADATWCAKQLRNGRQIPRRTLVLTFDDGLAGIAHAAPALIARGVTATMFVTPSLTYGNVYADRPTLSANALRDLYATGAFVPGVHGATHSSLRGADDTTLRRETIGARRAVAELLGYEPQLFAYPFGSFPHIDARARRAVIEAGYLAAFTGIYGPLQGDAHTLPRCRVSWAEDVPSFVALLRGGYDWYRFVQRVQALR